MSANPRRLLAAALVPGAVAAAVLAGRGGRQHRPAVRQRRAGRLRGHRRPIPICLRGRLPAQTRAVRRRGRPVQPQRAAVVVWPGGRARRLGQHVRLGLHPVREDLRRRQSPTARLGPQRTAVRPRGQLRPAGFQNSVTAADLRFRDLKCWSLRSLPVLADQPAEDSLSPYVSLARAGDGGRVDLIGARRP
jgi:hypothetical protein